MTDSRSRKQRDLSPVEAAERFVASRENRNSYKTVRSYRNRLTTFINWTDENDLGVMREMDGWWIDEYLRHLEA